MKTVTIYSIVIFIWLTGLGITAQNKPGDSTFIFKGKVVNVEKMNGLYNAHIINVNKNIGTVSFYDGTFQIHASPGDSLKISLIGYKTKIVEIKNSHRKRLTPLIIPLRFSAIDVQGITVYGKTYEQFKRDFVQLDIDPIPVNEEALETINDELDLLGPATPRGFTGPIQMLYDRFNETERLRRKILRNRRKYGNPEDYKNFPVYPSNIDTIPPNSQ